ncbi:5-oxoprolinase subunit PxpA [Actinotalea sp. K2]|uniref:LamB/YcsF family protein n=1 Tax=Actinotalea sp. K2 TaxID=2939438 RepID=UPI00201714D4|nr:5-oxoprolinase subunit PxpA [Actinotalea sp. K2]MCL3862374.1 LamB/YcsF family protein [Actinotalea sp. K2]
MTTIDLNCDLGESFGPWSMGDDAAMLALVSSANVACGFHGGDPLVARRTCTTAAHAQVRVGAHVGYRDLGGFGRRFVDVDQEELTAEVIYQIGALQAVARSAGTEVSHVKPHGALYNAIVHHREQARAVVAGIHAVEPALPLLVLAGSVVQEEAHAVGLRTVTEAFADRAYRRDGTLVPRGVEGAVLHDAEMVADRVVRMVVEGTVETVEGDVIEIDAQSVCLHADTAGAVALATAVRRALHAAGVLVASF